MNPAPPGSGLLRAPTFSLRERQARDVHRARAITMAVTRTLRGQGIAPTPRGIVALLRAHAISDAAFSKPQVKAWIAECDPAPRP